MDTSVQGVGPQKEYFVFGSSVIGPLHEMRSLPCQDSWTFGNEPSGLAVIAVADGAGSAAKSEVGAEVVVNSAVSAVKETMQIKEAANVHLPTMAEESVRFARKKLEEKASELQSPLADLASTLIVIVANQDYVSIAHIGDGAVVGKTNEGLILLSPPEESEYANETSFITGENWEVNLRVTPTFEGISAIAAFTDGCQRAALRKSREGFEPYDRFLEPLFSYAARLTDAEVGQQDIKELLSSRKLCDNSEDDKTLVIAILKALG